MDRRGFLASLGPGTPKAAASFKPPNRKARFPSGKVSAGLERYVPDDERPWNRRRAVHLLRRARVGRPSRREVDRALSAGPDETIRHLLAVGDLPAMPEWSEAPLEFPTSDDPAERERLLAQERQRRQELAEWQFGLWYTDTTVREKLTQFWLNHFVIEASKVRIPQLLLRYDQLMRSFASGNIRELTRSVGTSPAMLIYLDGIRNNRFSLNENYGRELQELFTIGRGNYTQDDVVSAARAYTGWRISRTTGNAWLDFRLFDWGQKTFYGSTGRLGPDDIVNLIFDRAECARFFADKLYRGFVYQVPDEDIVENLADLLVAHDFELAPVLAVLLSSAHFHDDAFLGAEETSPTDFLIGATRYLDIPVEDVNWSPFPYLLAALGQPLLDPPNVEGWPGSRAWLSTSTLPLRQGIAWYWLVSDEAQPGFDPVRFLSGFPEPENPERLLDDWIEDLSPFPLPEATRAELFQILTGGRPARFNPWREEGLQRVRVTLVALMQQAFFALA